MIDSHAHLYWESFQQDFESIIDRAVESNLTHIINIGVDLESSSQAVNQAREVKRLKVLATIGLHPEEFFSSLPHDYDVWIHDVCSKLEELYNDSPDKVVAIGECGLDYYHLPSPANIEPQKQLFKAQVELARKLNLPLVIHCRESWDDIFEHLDSNLTGVFHCWSGDLKAAQRALDLGFYISFAGNLTYKNAHTLRHVAQQIPLDRILVETDCPFLSPEGQRGQRNEPANVVEVAKTLAELKGLSSAEIDHQTTQNTLKLLKIKV